jgi:hypothetical protein
LVDDEPAPLDESMVSMQASFYNVDIANKKSNKKKEIETKEYEDNYS